MTAGDVVAALQANNLQVAAGAINQPPAVSASGFQLAVQTLGRAEYVARETVGDHDVIANRHAIHT